MKLDRARILIQKLTFRLNPLTADHIGSCVQMSTEPPGISGELEPDVTVIGLHSYLIAAKQRPPNSSATIQRKFPLHWHTKTHFGSPQTR